MQETQVRFLGQEDPLEEDMETDSSVLAWRIPWTEESGGLHTVHGVAKSWTWLSDWACVYIHTHECQLRWLFLRLRGQRLAMRVLGESWGEGLELPEYYPSFGLMVILGWGNVLPSPDFMQSHVMFCALFLLGLTSAALNSKWTWSWVSFTLNLKEVPLQTGAIVGVIAKFSSVSCKILDKQGDIYMQVL